MHSTKHGRAACYFYGIVLNNADGFEVSQTVLSLVRMSLTLICSTQKLVPSPRIRRWHLQCFHMAFIATCMGGLTNDSQYSLISSKRLSMITFLPAALSKSRLHFSTPRLLGSCAPTHPAKAMFSSALPIFKASKGTQNDDSQYQIACRFYALVANG